MCLMQNILNGQKLLSMDCISFIFNNKKIIYICSLFSLFYLILAALPAIAWASSSLTRKTRPGHGTSLIKENWPKTGVWTTPDSNFGPMQTNLYNKNTKDK